MFLDFYKQFFLIKCNKKKNRFYDKNILKVMEFLERFHKDFEMRTSKRYF